MIVNLGPLTFICLHLLYLVRDVDCNYFFQGTKKSVLTWVNGIGHNLDHMTDGQTSLSSLFGGRPVSFCHNPTAMTSHDDYRGYIGDLTQAGAQKLGKITAEVDALVSHLKDAVEEVGTNGRVIHIAHSQGALITALAIKRLSRQEMSKMEIISFGGAAALRRSDDCPFVRCVNYYSVNDPLLFIVPSAVRALQSGFLGSGGVIVRSNNQDNDGPSDESTTTDELSESEFVFLTPRSGDPIVDHGLLGPTYIEALTWEGRRYQQIYIPLAGRAFRFTSLYLIALHQSFIQNVLKPIVRRTLVPVIIFFAKFNALMKKVFFQVVQFLFNYVISPIIALLLVCWEIIENVIKCFQTEDERFDPVDQVILMESSENNE